MKWGLAILVSASGVLLAAPSVAAADIKAFVDGPLRPAMAKLADDFRAQAGHAVTSEFGAAPALKARLAAGEKADVLISLATDMEEMSKQGGVSALERAVARIKLGLAVRDGVAVPDISTMASFTKALHAADAVIHNNVASGRAFVGQLEKAGLAASLKGKLVEVPVPPGVMPEVIMRRGNELGVGQMSQIIEFAAKGVRIVGPVPAEVQVEIVYSAGALTGAQAGQAATAFVKFLGSPSAAATLAAAGAK